jgi:hypothetical protein
MVRAIEKQTIVPTTAMSSSRHSRENIIQADIVMANVELNKVGIDQSSAYSTAVRSVVKRAIISPVSEREK